MSAASEAVDMQGTWRFYRSIAVVLALGITTMWALDTDGGASAGSGRALGKQASSLDHALGGAAALVRAGNRLPEFAEANGMTVAELARELRNDPNLLLDLAGLAVYVDEAPTAVPTSEPALPGIGEADAFALHSRPGAAQIIYLDVDGHITSGTSWNSGGSITSAPFDLDGNPGSFNQTERDRVHAWWLQVSEDFAPWDVDVTTQEPSVDRLRKDSSSDPQHGIRVVISPTNWYSTSASGVAYRNSFSYSNDTPVFVFTDQLAGGHAKYTSETISHEVGHSLSLAHDGNASNSYDTGHADWAPIMGASFSRPISQWSRGDYGGANNQQDDLALIGTFVPLRADDHGDDIGTATALGDWATVTGLISVRSDVDVYAVDASGSRLTARLDSAVVYPNLNAALRLLDASGRVITTADGSGTGPSSLDIGVAAGRYYLVVEGVGTGDAVTAYTDYASLGRYELTVDARADTSTITTLATTTTTTIAPTTTTTQPTTTTTAPTTTQPTTTTTVATTTVPNRLPTPTISASSLAVAANESLTFDGRGSFDGDGGAIVRYDWRFDGIKPPRGSSAVETRSWSSTGTYEIQLTVTDDEGTTSSTSVSIVVSTSGGGGGEDPTAEPVSIMSVAVETGPSGGAVAVVDLVDDDGEPVASVVVEGTWSGATKGRESMTSDATGTARSTENQLRGRTSTVSFDVTKVIPPAGYRWDGTTASASTQL